ncbi:MAG: ribonuclease HII [Nitrospiraceae bacterium]|nr:MAG: ribonuclease HII [Nitrospiraceae bacterium]
MPSRKVTNTADTPSIFLHDEGVRPRYPLVAGIDEAGRGPLAGPVVAAAVILPSGLVIKRLRDSKKVPENERKDLFWKVVYNATAIGIGIVTADVIDKINILESTKLAMKTAVQDLKMKPDILLIDAVKLSDVSIAQQSIIKGESVSASIAAASVIAKVVRDDIMLDCHDKYPLYNFKRHKGYSTEEHMDCISRYGPCPIHRLSFRKVMDVQLPLIISRGNRRRATTRLPQNNILPKEYDSL